MERAEGARFPQLWEHAKFIRMISAGLREPHALDVVSTKEAPNYRAER